MSTPHVVIVGGGFGGLEAAKALRRAPVQVTLVDRRNHHLFQPLLYQVATAALSPAQIAAPLRSILRKQRNATVLLAEARGFDLAARELVLADGKLGYDFLVVAAGASHAYFGHDEWAGVAPGLKSIEDAIEIRRRILVAYEAAERETDPGRRKALLTFIVVGGGPTGVELAGALAEISRQTLLRDFRHIDPSSARVLLVEGGPRVLGPFPEPLSQKALEQLVRLGVEVKTGATVTHIDKSAVTIGAERIPAHTVLWAAGVAASPLGKALGAPLDRAGRVLCEKDLTLPGRAEVFVVGDLCACLHDTGKPLPGVAPVAMQQGRYVAAAILASLRGQARAPFHYSDKGNLATIGRAAAVADFGSWRISGFLAWMAWLTIHIFFLIGFRNRLLVLFEWAWAYVTHQRGARLITGAVEVGATAEVDQPAAKAS